MKRIEEKVKDIVDVRACAKLNDFTTDPAETLGAYRFTDVTSDLMAKWLDRLSETKAGKGAAMALAGFRGVGKSHFLATFGALAAHIELRSKVDDSHVSTRASRMARRHFPVAHVHRGRDESLLKELKTGVAELLDCNPSNLSESLSDLLAHAADKGGDSPTVILIDTAMGRGTRVARDDGAFLSEMADAAKQLGIFVAIALDDDIAGADGVNAAISQSFEIHYLDQDHLYKIVDSHIFPKHYHMRGILHDIYENYRAVLPGFNWSEERFASLYPLHPAILETAPFVRLYLHNFALLGFAAEAGVRIMGRPANSLIALDEVFDNVEKELRKIDDLKDDFEVFDTLDREVVAKVPVMKRLRAKLILKGLFLLSLDGEGPTAPELAASMMIFDDESPATAVNEVNDVLNSFVDAAPGSISQVEMDGRHTRFLFVQTGKEDLNAVLSDAAGDVSIETVLEILRKSMAEKYVDLRFNESGHSVFSDCSVVWNGGVRRGKVVWTNDFDNASVPEFSDSQVDWISFVTSKENPLPESLKDLKAAVVEWRTADLRKDELELLRRFHLLQTRVDFRDNFPEHFNSALHRHSIAVDQIWKRVFLEQSVLVIDGLEYNLTDEARAAYSLPLMFSKMLEPMFECRFPQHPVFTSVLGLKEAAALINEVFAGSSSVSEEIENLAKSFALPLGLVENAEGHFSVATGESLIQLPFVKQALDETEFEKGEVVPVTKIYSSLAAPPFGFTREFQHLILSSLVAQRQIEFVTSNGNRINRRSLDLQIVWEDITGIAKPSFAYFSAERLRVWTTLFTVNRSAGDGTGPLAPTAALLNWLEDWESNNSLSKFENIPDESLNTKIWRIAMNVKKSFQVVAELVSGLRDEAISVNECLQSIADVFSDSEEEFELRKLDLEVLTAFCENLADCVEIEKYLSLAETTSSSEIETLRSQLFESISDASQYDAEKTRDTWQRYKTLYSENYQANHDSVMHSSEFRDKFEQIRRSDLWFEYESFAKTPIFDSSLAERSDSILRELRKVRCSYETDQLLRSQPFCSCDFTLLKAKIWEDLPTELWKNVNDSHESFRMFLKEEKVKMIHALDEFAESVEDQETLHAIDNLITISKHEGNFGRFSLREIQVLKIVIEQQSNIDPHFALPLFAFQPHAGSPDGIQHVYTES